MVLEWQKVIFEGTVYALICSLLVMVSLWRMPRIWLQDFPEDIQEKVHPKTEREKKHSLMIGIPFLLFLFAGPFLSGLSWKLSVGSGIPFFYAFHACVFDGHAFQCS